MGLSFHNVWWATQHWIYLFCYLSHHIIGNNESSECKMSGCLSMDVKTHNIARAGFISPSYHHKLVCHSVSFSSSDDIVFTSQKLSLQFIYFYSYGKWEGQR